MDVGVEGKSGDGFRAKSESGCPHSGPRWDGFSASCFPFDFFNVGLV